MHGCMVNMEQPFSISGLIFNKMLILNIDFLLIGYRFECMPLIKFELMDFFILISLSCGVIVSGTKMWRLN